MTDVTGNALAPESVHSVDTSAAVVARVRRAIVDVYLTAGSGEPDGATANVTRPGSGASTAVVARFIGAIIDFVLTVGARETGRTVASVSRRRIFARGSVLAGQVSAGQTGRLAMRAHPMPGAFAAVSAQAEIGATPAVHARFVGATVYFGFAIRPGESGRAGAGVRALSGVETGTAVLAGLVIGTVVEVLVAEETAPSFVAQAVPRLLATSVETTGITFAFRAEPSLPAAVTPAIDRKKTNILIIVYK